MNVSTADESEVWVRWVVVRDVNAIFFVE
jgi:hypothetical protein